MSESWNPSDPAHPAPGAPGAPGAPVAWQINWGRLLRTARQVAGLSLSDLSAATGLSKGYLSKLESGHSTALNPSRATLAALARALPSFGPVAHTLQPDQIIGTLALGEVPHQVPAFLATPDAHSGAAPVHLGWRELEVLVGLLALEGAALLQPLTVRTVARALGRAPERVERTLEALVRSGVVQRRPPSRAGGGTQYALGTDCDRRVGVTRIGDVLVLAAALLAQSPVPRRRIASERSAADDDEM
jgi:transcriptional regulator with XRE-family HTH domain